MGTTAFSRYARTRRLYEPAAPESATRGVLACAACRTVLRSTEAPCRRWLPRSVERCQDGFARGLIGCAGIIGVAATTTFFVELRSLPIEVLLGLTLGGVLAAPFGAYLARVLPARPLMTAVGLLIAGLAGYQVANSVW